MIADAQLDVLPTGIRRPDPVFKDIFINDLRLRVTIESKTRSPVWSHVTFGDFVVWRRDLSRRLVQISRERMLAQKN